MVAGDLNLHFSCLASANRTYEAPLDRYVQAYLEARDGFDCQLLNRANVPTHVSGTVVDVVAIPRGSIADIEYITGTSAGVLSDHVRLDVKFQGSWAFSGCDRVGRARWEAGGDWGRALAEVPCAVEFMTGWAGEAMLSPRLRGWVALGQKRGTDNAFLTE